MCDDITHECHSLPYTVTPPPPGKYRHRIV